MALPDMRHLTVDFDVPTEMRDGTVLRADVVRPATAEPVPVLLIRNPYPSMVARRQLDQFRAARMGFAVVSQAVRGTGASEGVFEPWCHEQSDGVDTIAWCASQSWSSGAVGTYGNSYLGHTQHYSASGAPPALKAMSPGVVPSDPYDLTYKGGALCLASSMFWAVSQAGGRLFRAQAGGADVQRELGEFGAAMANIWSLYRTTPLRDLPLLAENFPSWQDWLDHPTNDEWWRAVAVGDRPAAPSYYSTGWWDLFLRGSLDEFAREPRHPSSRMTIGPWSHMIDGSAHGQMNYGASAASMAIDLEGRRLGFLHRTLVQGATEPDGPPVRLFVMGANRWRDEDAWPLARARSVRYFLQPGGGLSPESPVTDALPMTFLFDPLDPVPTVGGPNLVQGSDGAFLTGPQDQRSLNTRTDILRFVSRSLQHDLEVTGEITMTLHAATSAVDTDWTAKLVDVWPDGRAFNVVDSIVRARHRTGTDRAESLPLGVPHRFEIDLVATSQVFKAGHRLRVDISSSNFPRFDRNPGTGALSANVGESEFVSAHQTVFIDAERPSWITLPVVDA